MMKVTFAPEAWKKWRAYIDQIDYEISGFGKVEKRADGFYVTDVKIFEQEVTSSHTVMDARALAKFFDDLLVAGEDPVNWKLWWHSHVNMPAYFSGTDYATIDEFDTEEPAENWMLSIVTNKSGSYHAQANIYQPIPCVLGPLFVVHESLEGVPDVSVKEEIDAKVEIKVYNYTPPNQISFVGERDIPEDVDDMTFQEKMDLLDHMPGRRSKFHFPLQKPDEPIEGEIVT